VLGIRFGTNSKYIVISIITSIILVGNLGTAFSSDGGTLDQSNGGTNTSSVSIKTSFGFIMGQEFVTTRNDISAVDVFFHDTSITPLGVPVGLNSTLPPVSSTMKSPDGMA